MKLKINRAEVRLAQKGAQHFVGGTNSLFLSLKDALEIQRPSCVDLSFIYHFLECSLLGIDLLSNVIRIIIIA